MALYFLNSALLILKSDFRGVQEANLEQAPHQAADGRSSGSCCC